jgi:RimJ/RimL family protein N-acetyltransferase
MSVLFFVHDGVWAAAGWTIKPVSGADWRWWLPERDGPPRAGPMRAQNSVWWALDQLGKRLGGFAQPGLAELTLVNTTGVLARALVTPRWYRFPFMAAADLQIGEIWTRPDARRQGLARAAISEVLRFYARSGQRIWMLVDADNVASATLIRSLGFKLVGTGKRSRPGGIAAIGQFHLSTSDGHPGDRA